MNTRMCKNLVATNRIGKIINVFKLFRNTDLSSKTSTENGKDFVDSAWPSTRVGNTDAY